MKQLSIIATALIFAHTAKAQSVIDTIDMEPGYAKQVFFQVATGAKHTSPISQWHIAHTTVMMDNAVRLNHAAGVFAYIYPKGDNTAYNSFDTTGWANWAKPYNDMKSESLGALNQQKDPNNQWDFSWGVYDPSSHVVKGDSLYLITVGTGANLQLYKFMPIKQDKNGDFIFEFGPLDAQAGNPDTIKNSRADMGMFKYFNFSLDQQVNIESADGDWHLNFNRYYDLVPDPRGGGLVMYPTNGVESKRGLEVAYANGVDFADILANPQSFIDIANSDTAKQSGNGFNLGLTRVGGDWKFFNGSSFAVVPRKNYIIKVNGTVAEYWALRFLSFAGQSTGRITLERAKLGELASNKNIEATVIGLFPNPVNDKLFVSINHNELQHIKLYSINGILVKEVVANGNLFEMDLSDVNSGQYIVEALHTQGVARKIIVKQ